jgi:hypothetical protein
MALDQLEQTVKALQCMKRPPPVQVRICMVVCWVQFVVFVFGLPWWSTLFNDTFGYGAILCTADGKQTECTNMDDYAAWARENGRVRKDNSTWACSCEEGVFSDSVCLPSYLQYWSISHYISAAPGTGGLVAVTAFPILFVWMYGGSNPLILEAVLHTSYTSQQKERKMSLITLSQAVFQVFYGLFLFCSLCVFTDAHGIVVVCFIIAEVVHMVLLAMSMGTHTTAGKAILATTIIGMTLLILLIAVASVAAALDSTVTFFLYCFWLGECIGFSAILSIPCILAWIPQEDVPYLRDVPYLNSDEIAQPLAAEKADGDSK